MFEPFPMLRALRDDDQLTVHERIVLMCAVLRTDKHGRVRAEQKRIAKDAGVSERTVRNVLHSRVGQYYFTFDRSWRQLNLTWRSHRHGVPPARDAGDLTGTGCRPSTYIGTKGQRSPSGMRVVPSTGSTPGSQGQAVAQGNRASRQSGVSSTTGTGHGGGSQTGASSTTGPAAPLPLPPRPIEPKRSDYDSGEVFLSDLDEYYDRLDEYISIRMMNDTNGFREDR